MLPAIVLTITTVSRKLRAIDCGILFLGPAITTQENIVMMDVGINTLLINRIFDPQCMANTLIEISLKAEFIT